MAKICPHSSTGRADYFGSAVNRAARLLCAAKAGQVLVEEHVMDSVITDWRGDGGKPKSCPWVKGLHSGDKQTDLIPAVNRRLQAMLGDGHRRPDGRSLSLDEPAELAKRSKSVPLNEIRRWALTGRASPSNQPSSKLSLEAPEGASSASSQSEASEVQGGVAEDAFCTPHASHSPLAVSNCHMLKFLAESGLVEGRREGGTVRSNASRSLTSKKYSQAAESSQRMLLSAGNSLETSFDPAMMGDQPIPGSASQSSPKSSDAPHRVAWQDGISFQEAKLEAHVAMGNKQGSLVVSTATTCVMQTSLSLCLVAATTMEHRID